MNKAGWLTSVVVLACCMVSSAFGASNNVLPKGVKLPKDVPVPNDVPLAIYLPPSELSSRFYVSSLGIWVEPGKALDDARRDVGQRLFTSILPVDLKSDGAYGLLLKIHPNWTATAGQLQLEMKYKVIGADGQQLLEGTQKQTAPINSPTIGGGFQAAAYKVMQTVLIDVLKKLTPNASKYSQTAQLASISTESLADKSKPVSTGTGFYINKSGQLMTAAHVLRDCLIIEASKDGASFPVTHHASSDLLDLAVVNSNHETDKALPLRIEQELLLGESVTNVGYPLQGLLASNPNVTRGNVSARGGLKGSVGLFQFSAPIQPGSSGGPVVSDGGELLGITVGTLNATSLIKNGLLPQNVNFALDAKHAATFLRKSNVAFTEVTPNLKGDMRMANEAALASVVQLSCYQ